MISYLYTSVTFVGNVRKLLRLQIASEIKVSNGKENL